MAPQETGGLASISLVSSMGGLCSSLDCSQNDVCTEWVPSKYFVTEWMKQWIMNMQVCDALYACEKSVFNFSKINVTIYPTLKNKQTNTKPSPVFFYSLWIRLEQVKKIQNIKWSHFLSLSLLVLKANLMTTGLVVGLWIIKNYFARNKLGLYDPTMR